MERTTLRWSRRGLATVEMALALPLLLLIVLGTVEYGWMFLKAQQVTMAAHAGARAGALAGGTAADATAAIAQRMAQSGIGTYTVTMTPQGGPASLGRGEVLTVEVAVQYADVAVLGTSMIPTPQTLTARSSIAREGP